MAAQIIIITSVLYVLSVVLKWSCCNACVVSKFNLNSCIMTLAQRLEVTAFVCFLSSLPGFQFLHLLVPPSVLPILVVLGGKCDLSTAYAVIVKDMLLTVTGHCSLGTGWHTLITHVTNDAVLNATELLRTNTQTCSWVMSAQWHKGRWCNENTIKANPKTHKQSVILTDFVPDVTSKECTNSNVQSH